MFRKTLNEDTQNHNQVDRLILEGVLKMKEKSSK